MMKRAKTVVVLGAFLILSGRLLFASSVGIRQSLGGNGAGGAIVSLEVRNVTGGTIQNVDVRLQQPQRNSLPKGVVQFGTLANHQSRMASTAIVLNADPKEPFVWQVDFDDAAGHHTESVIANR